MIPLKNTERSFGLLSRVLHWVIALLILGLIWLGWYMVDLTYYDPWYNKSLHYHKSLGMLVLFIFIIKLCWHLYSPKPENNSAATKFAQTAAKVMHVILLLMTALLPISGYLISTSAGKPIELFNWFAIPAIFDVGHDMRDLAIDVHYYLAYITLFLVIGHASAAIKHQLVDKDGTLARMLWGKVK